jgi:N utilization substance protein A
LQPAEIIRVLVNESDKTMEVIVPEEQLLLAIGKRGQNVKLASKLVGWMIEVRAEGHVEDALKKAEGLFAPKVAGEESSSEEAPKEATEEKAPEEAASGEASVEEDQEESKAEPSAPEPTGEEVEAPPPVGESGVVPAEEEVPEEKPEG